MAREVAGKWSPGSAVQLPGREAPKLKSRPLVLVPHRFTPAERHRRTCELAYRLAEQRGFTAGGEVDDWLEAEREVDAGRY